MPSIAKPVATRLYNKYILRNTPEEVNLSHEARVNVEKGLANGNYFTSRYLVLTFVDPPLPSVFDMAEKEVYGLMR